MSAPRYIVGIDLGTTNTVVAYADTAEATELPAVHTLPIPSLVGPGEVAARELLPSARYHPAEGELPPGARTLPWSANADGTGPTNDTLAQGVVGHFALSLGARVPSRLVTSAKSWLCHGAVDRTEPILPWGAPADVLKVSPVDASASYLAHVRAAWEERFPGAPLSECDVVLTVPASFDEAARSLTLEAATKAGIPKVRLVEEPQAAFYDWLYRHAADAEKELADSRLAVVVDVGGGTTDLSLIRVELRDSGLRVTRVAVGDHLMLGGDNMDLLLAKHAEPRISPGASLGTGRFAELVAQSRAAKELLLREGAPAHTSVTVLGAGSKLIGGTKSTELGREEVESQVLEGFFPEVGTDARPDRRSSALMEFGLPYVADPAITKHLAAFLGTHQDVARDAVGDADGALALPDAVLLNGGVYLADKLRDRVIDTLSTWRGAPVRLLDNPHPSLAVARGAAAYALARRGKGLRIGGGSARAFFLALGGADGHVDGATDTAEETPNAICLLPKGAEEGEELELPGRTFSLKVGKPVRFRVASSTSDVQHHRPGDLLRLDDERHRMLPPIAVVLAPKDAADTGKDVPVHVVSALTEIGTLEMNLVRADRPSERWKLEFQLRGTSSGGEVGQIRQLHPRFAEATERVRRVYGKSADDVGPKDVKTLRTDLERLLGERNGWDTPLLRELFGALFGGVKRRRRSSDHERVWFNLVGYTLRPGFGYPLDDYRIGELWSVWKDGVQYAPDAQNWAEWWILWRRVSGGLDATKQEAMLTDLEWYLEPEGGRPKTRPSGPKKLGYDDMVRLAGSLEHPSAEQKSRVGNWLVARLGGGKENPQTWWAVGRLGARVPFYGSAHRVVPAETAQAWLRAALSTPWATPDAPAAFAATLLARVSGDRARDLDEASRLEVRARLEAAGAPDAWLRMVTEVTHLDASDERRVFGESLPPGLRLL
ncbi:MAG: hsp70 family protein [Myxococcales bacterium]|nr:hsp70 family protein [Myxococcales bacterium]